jgi:hypothetical protein
VEKSGFHFVPSFLFDTIAITDAGPPSYDPQRFVQEKYILDFRCSAHRPNHQTQSGYGPSKVGDEAAIKILRRRTKESIQRYQEQKNRSKQDEERFARPRAPP